MNYKIKTICAALPIMALASTSQAALVSGWVTFSGDAAFAGGSEATGSPTTTDADADTIAASFADITLADGDLITLSGTFSVDVISPATQFRWGMFDGASPVVAGSGSGYSGLYAGNPSNSTVGTINFADGSATNPFSSAATSLNPGSLGTTSVAFPANTPIDFLLSITRDGANLDIMASITDGGTYNSSVSFEDVVSTQYTYNTAAFLMGGSLNGTEGIYTDVDVTYTPVPEPSSTALLGLGGLALILRRRK